MVQLHFWPRDLPGMAERDASRKEGSIVWPLASLCPSRRDEVTLANRGWRAIVTSYWKRRT